MLEPLLILSQVSFLKVGHTSHHIRHFIQVSVLKIQSTEILQDLVDTQILSKQGLFQY